MATRRTILRVVGTGLLGGVAGCAGGGNGTDNGRGMPPGSTADSGPVTTVPSPPDVETRLLPDDGGAGDNFGAAVAVTPDGRSALVGAPRDGGPNGANAGSAYHFEWTGGEWHQRAKLAAPDGNADDQFGSGVALSTDGRTALVGARFDDDPNGERGGSAHAFERADGEWVHRATLAPADGSPAGFFGAQLTLSGDGRTAFVTAVGEREPNGNQAGAVHVYRRADGGWTRDATLVADDGDEDDLFGFGLGVADGGRTAVVGAIGDEDPNGTTGDLFGGAGSAYHFERANGRWHQRAKLVPEDGDAGDQFGAAVALSPDGGTAFIGAFTDDDPNGGGAGSVYVFERTGGTWERTQKLAAGDGDSGDGFGRALATVAGGDLLLVGAEGDDDPNGEDGGSVYAFERTGEGWRQRAKLAPEAASAGAGFGRSLAAARTAPLAVAGALNDTTEAGKKAGAAYILAP